MTINLTTESTTNISLPICSQNVTANCSTQAVATNAVGFNALIYICTVLVFYALSIVCLMIKYIRREKEDAILERYYTDFVKRETFHSLNRHKYYSELFKKFEKTAGKNSPLSAVYNQTDIYARRSIPPEMCHHWDKTRRLNSALWHDEGISTGALTDISEETERLTHRVVANERTVKLTESRKSTVTSEAEYIETDEHDATGSGDEEETDHVLASVSVHNESESDHVGRRPSGPDTCWSS